jgi:DNA-binding XRE family transcriptional regulator
MVNLVILLNGFTKKTQKTPKNEIEKGSAFDVESIMTFKKEVIMNTRGWKEIEDEVYGKKGTSRRDELEREFESFKIGLLLKKAHEDKHLTQEQLADLVDKKRTYISRVENDGSNMTLKTLFDIVEKGLGRKSKDLNPNIKKT